MKKIIIAALFCLPGSLLAQELSSADLDAMPGVKGSKEEASAPVPRPDAQGIMADLSTSLRLSSKQEQRISSAMKKQASEFDKLLREYDKSAEEEKKWRFKMNDARYRMLKLNRDIPDVIRGYLDDEQREAFDAMVAEKRRKAAAAAAPAQGPAAKPAAKPVRKKRLVRRKKPAAPKAAAPAPRPAPAPAEEPVLDLDSDIPMEEPDAGSYP